MLAFAGKVGCVSNRRINGSSIELKINAVSRHNAGSVVSPRCEPDRQPHGLYD